MPRLRHSGPGASQHDSLEWARARIRKRTLVAGRLGPVRTALARFAFVVMLLGPAPLARAATSLPNELTSVAGVRFEGRRHVNAKDLKKALKTRASGHILSRQMPVLRMDFLGADVQAIEDVYHQHGYLDVAAGYELVPGHDAGTVIVRFKIIEGRQTHIGRIDLTGVTAIQGDALRRLLFAKRHKAFNPYFLVADTAKIAEAYKDRGYFPSVHAVTERHDFSMNVRYDVTEGQRFRFGEVRIPDLDKLSVNEHFVRRELLIKPDAVYRSTRVQQSVEHLYETGMFDQVQMTPLMDSTAARVEFDLGLHERRHRWVDAGIGSGTSERVLATGEWGHRSLLGSGRQGTVDGRLALDGQARFLLSRIETTLLEPWLFATRTRGLLTLYYVNQHDRPTSPPRLIESQSRGVSFQVSRQLGRYATLALTQDNAWVTQSQVVTDPTVGDSLLEPSYTTHRLQLEVARDTRDHPVLMTRGSYQAFTSEVAGGPLQGTSSFTKQHLESSWYTPLRPGWLLATHARGGVIRPFGKDVLFSSDSTTDPGVARVPVFDRFKIGGVNSLRGYDERELPANGGLVLLQGNVELRVDVLGPLGLELYVDAGNVWTGFDAVKRGRFVPEISSSRMTPNDVRFVFGFGPRLQLPFGPLRVDFTWWARPDETGKRQRGIFQFAIGPAF